MQYLSCLLKVENFVSFLSAEFEDAMKKREHEFRVQVDEMNAKVLEYDLKVWWSYTTIMYIYRMLVNAPSAHSHIIHINLNMIFYIIYIYM